MKAVIPALAVIATAALVAWCMQQEQLLQEQFMASLPEVLPAEDFAPVDPDGAIQRFSRAIQFQTVGNHSAPNGITNTEPFDKMHAFLRESFPRVFETLEFETISTYSLLFKWPGLSEESGSLPGLLMSHMDVVPVSPADVPGWAHPPFGGSVAEGFVWGRGTLDVKVTLMAILEAVEDLLKSGFRPQKTLFLAFGHDEETGGRHGAVAIVKRLQEKGVTKLDFVLDEGGTVMTDGFSAITQTPVALVGTAEKGMANVEMTIQTAGGHSSMPPLDGSMVGSILSRVLSRLDKAPINPNLMSPTSDMLVAMAPVAPWWLRPILRNARLPALGFTLAQVLGLVKESAAMTRTTLAATKIEAGIALNVMAQTATVNFNSRVMPGETRADVVQYINVTGVAKDALSASLELLDLGHEPSPVSNMEGPVFAHLREAILKTLPDKKGEMVVAPYLVVGATDSRYYTGLTSDVFRFCPLLLNKTGGDIGRFHANNERIGVQNYLKAIRFYKYFISSAFAT